MIKLKTILLLMILFGCSSDEKKYPIPAIEELENNGITVLDSEYHYGYAMVCSGQGDQEDIFNISMLLRENKILRTYVERHGLFAFYVERKDFFKACKVLKQVKHQYEYLKVAEYNPKKDGT